MCAYEITRNVKINIFYLDKAQSSILKRPKGLGVTDACNAATGCASSLDRNYI